MIWPNHLHMTDTYTQLYSSSCSRAEVYSNEVSRHPLVYSAALAPFNLHVREARVGNMTVVWWSVRFQRGPPNETVSGLAEKKKKKTKKNPPPPLAMILTRWLTVIFPVTRACRCWRVDTSEGLKKPDRVRHCQGCVWISARVPVATVVLSASNTLFCCLF